MDKDEMKRYWEFVKAETIKVNDGRGGGIAKIKLSYAGVILQFDNADKILMAADRIINGINNGLDEVDISDLESFDA